MVQDRPIPDYKAIEPCIIKIHENADLISLQMKCELLTIKVVRPSKPPAHTAHEALPPLMYELGLDLSDASNAYNTHLLRRRNPVTPYKESAIAFMCVLNILIQKKVAKKTLIKSLEAYPQIFVRTWLREKINAYHSVVYRSDE